METRRFERRVNVLQAQTVQFAARAEQREAELQRLRGDLAETKMNVGTAALREGASQRQDDFATA